ncbi:hypothetical protein [Streptomyces hygroscopicus]|uniref:hypothetical protein n=1 Tax=Streptomyces hygroscopicus TaxID=1912 RepID=UPI0022409B1A|nr:hypothetical protein [Streptomyces hygroscopicus]
MWASTTPAAIAGLVDVLRRDPDLTATTVFDGPQATGWSGTEAITVGYTDEETSHSVDGSVIGEGLALSPTREQYTIQCAIWVLNGSADITAARERAYAVLAVVGGALTSDQTLGGAVAAARLAAVALQQEQTQQGAVASIFFGVEVDTYT